MEQFDHVLFIHFIVSSRPSDKMDNDEEREKTRFVTCVYVGEKCDQFKQEREAIESNWSAAGVVRGEKKL